jgi:hypothetical protein
MAHSDTAPCKHAKALPCPRAGRRLPCCLTAVVLLTACGVAQAAGVSPSGQELTSAQSWATARLAPADADTPPGLLVHRNYGVVQRNGRGKGLLRLGDATYTRGFYCHANSELEVRLPGPAQRFTATLGVDSNSQTSGGRGSVVYSIEVDGATVFRSEVLREGARPCWLTFPWAASGASCYALMTAATVSPATRRIGRMHA